MTLQAPPFPKRLELELVSACNLKCTYCPRRYLKPLSGHMSLALLRKLIDEASAYPETILTLHRRGESLLHPRFNEALDIVAGQFKDVQMATNGTLLDPDKYEALVRGLTFLSFSLDAPASFDRTRIPAKYEVVERKILAFLDFNRGRIKTQVSMVRTDKTPESDVEAFKAVWQGRADRVRIYEEHSVDGRFGAMRRPRAARRPCVMPFYELLVYDDGKVGRCNHDWDSEPMGDLNRCSIAELWRSPAYEDLRRQHRELRLTDPVCRDCDSWYAEEGRQGTGEVVEK